MSNRGDLFGQFSPRHMHTGTQATSYGIMKLDRNEGYWGKKEKAFFISMQTFFINVATLFKESGKEKLA